MIIKTIATLVITFLSFSCNQQGRQTGNTKTYNSVEVAFFNKSNNIKIQGTLTLPKSGGPFPSAILVPGSGRTNRNGTEDNNLKPLYEIADFLTKNGMAVLRCDKRAVGDSEGTLDLNTTIDDLVSIEYMSQRPEIDKSRIGLIGHSYGGLIAAKASIEKPQILFVVMLGSPGIKNGEILLQQIGDISRLFEIADTTIVKFQDIIKNTSEILNSTKTMEDKRSHVELMYKERMHRISDAERNTLKHFGYDFSPDAHSYSMIVAIPYFYEFYTFDPQNVLKNVKCPILSIVGEKDLQVNPQINQPAIEKALIAGGNSNYSIQTPKGYNHLFQKTTTGNPIEYERQKVTIAPEILNNIFTWISSLSKSNTKTK
jgi:alpha/beta superfamily hydrolase